MWQISKAFQRTSGGIFRGVCVARASYSTGEPSKVIVGFNKVRDLIHGIEPSKYELIDVREPSETSLGYIPTCRKIPLGEVSEAFSLKDKDFEAKYGFEKPKAETQVIFYCRSGVRSMKALEAVEKLGLGLQ
ncbi:hypothetical protein BB560_005546 [Smittium megazygosporum]|uniref:Rhodanese domain-containing protein n=1 Tax=Smittium megazygosporum TaxID=133381 RepID=A0A2T9Z3J9_9FUNG|nr:hypothetical protein BB560_005546 [Smittium megazygosporum]